MLVSFVEMSEFKCTGGDVFACFLPRLAFDLLSDNDLLGDCTVAFIMIRHKSNTSKLFVQVMWPWSVESSHTKYASTQYSLKYSLKQVYRLVVLFFLWHALWTTFVTLDFWNAVDRRASSISTSPDEFRERVMDFNFVCLGESIFGGATEYSNQLFAVFDWFYLFYSICGEFYL